MPKKDIDTSAITSETSASGCVELTQLECVFGGFGGWDISDLGGQGGYVRQDNGTYKYVSGPGGYVANGLNQDGSGGLVRWQPGNGSRQPGPTPGIGGRFHWVPDGGLEHAPSNKRGPR